MRSNNEVLVSLRLITYIALYVTFSSSIDAHSATKTTNLRQLSCTEEIENANRTIVSWSVAMRQMIAESASPKTLESLPNGNHIVEEETKIQELIEKFGTNMHRRPIEMLVKDLVSIRRRSNRMALEIYLKTYDMRWPQTSVQLGVAVDKVQRACLSNLDRAAMLVLNSPFRAMSKSHSIRG